MTPPSLPPHLQRALLNSSFSNSHKHRTGGALGSLSDSHTHSHNPNLLPLPHHVMLNHLYLNSFSLTLSPLSKSTETSISNNTCKSNNNYKSNETPIEKQNSIWTFEEEKVKVFAVTTRFKSKFVTTILYKVPL